VNVDRGAFNGARSPRHYRALLSKSQRLDVDAYVECHQCQALSGSGVGQTCIDVGTHLISAQGWRVLTDVRDTLTYRLQTNPGR
jgi:hypothetical protein